MSRNFFLPLFTSGQGTNSIKGDNKSLKQDKAKYDKCNFFSIFHITTPTLDTKLILQRHNAIVLFSSMGFYSRGVSCGMSNLRQLGQRKMVCPRNLFLKILYTSHTFTLFQYNIIIFDKIRIQEQLVLNWLYATSHLLNFVLFRENIMSYVTFGCLCFYFSILAKQRSILNAHTYCNIHTKCIRLFCFNERVLIGSYNRYGLMIL